MEIHAADVGGRNGDVSRHAVPRPGGRVVDDLLEAEVGRADAVLDFHLLPFHHALVDHAVEEALAERDGARRVEMLAVGQHREVVDVNDVHVVVCRLLYRREVPVKPRLEKRAPARDVAAEEREVEVIAVLQLGRDMLADVCDDGCQVGRVVSVVVVALSLVPDDGLHFRNPAGCGNRVERRVDVLDPCLEH